MEAGTLRQPVKSPAAFRTIAEVADELDLPQHVLRFWETKFPQIKPLKRGGGRRYYRPEDVVLLRHIQNLLHREGYTIRGAQKVLRESRRKPAAADEPANAPDEVERPDEARTVGASIAPDLRKELVSLLSELRALRRLVTDGKP